MMFIFLDFYYIFSGRRHQHALLTKVFLKVPEIGVGSRPIIPFPKISSMVLKLADDLQMTSPAAHSQTQNVFILPANICQF